MKTNKPALHKIVQTRQTLRDIVQERMREAIIEGHFEPGERLVERPLCDQLGVSRTVIRETIRYLEAEGLVEILPNRGPIVSRIDWETAGQIYDIRKQLETAAAMAFAENHGAKSAARLAKALRKLETASAQGDVTALFKATEHFYEVIFTEAGHEVAWEIVRRLNGRISRLRVLTLSTDDRLRPGLVHMTEICGAILARDARAAQSAVLAHITDAASVAQRALEDANA